MTLLTINTELHLTFTMLFNNLTQIMSFHPQIISDYCKNVHQSKPFSHIMMELFKKLISDPNFKTAPAVDEQQNTVPRNQVVNGDGHK